MAKCRICGAAHRACGPASTVTPVDTNVSTPREGNMALKQYEVTVDGRHPHKTTLMLSDEDAERMGVLGQHKSQAKKAPAKKAPAKKSATSAANKARAPRNKATTAPVAAPAETVPLAVEEASDPDASE